MVHPWHCIHMPGLAVMVRTLNLQARHELMCRGRLLCICSCIGSVLLMIMLMPLCLAGILAPLRQAQ